MSFSMNSQNRSKMFKVFVDEDGNFEKFSNSKLSFSEMFPVMSHLTLGRIQVDDMSWIGGFEHDLYYPSKKYDIFFKRVKKLKFEISFRKLPRNFSFENLDDLEIVDPDTHDPDWINFVERNKNFNRVLVSNYRLSGTEFLRFASMNLTDLSVWIGEDVDKESIANFISNNNNLLHFRMNKLNEPDDQTKDLIKNTLIFFRNSLADWNVQVISNEIIFVRK